jgi:hypothetical protein
MFNDKRIIVVTSKIVGNILSSRGFIIKSVVIKMTNAIATESAKRKSSRLVGIGNNNTIKMPTMTNAKIRSV